MDRGAQERLHEEKTEAKASKAETSRMIRRAGRKGPGDAEKFVAKAAKALDEALAAARSGAAIDDASLDAVELRIRELREVAGSK